MANASSIQVLNEASHESFLVRNRLTEETWEMSKCVWAELQEIARDHENNLDTLVTSAEFFAKTIQRFEGVHSVRWRVKDTEHLLEKIVRKRADADGKPDSKYAEINVDNYFESVTDLVGIRALHLFKDDCFAIHDALMRTWEPIEDPIAYTREGDYEELKARLVAAGFQCKDHPAGYRSLHYVVESSPTQRTIRAEIQVRTLFEEGWSEIDHTVRYPNFSNDQLISYLLMIFNRMAGSADEMGGFVRDLDLVLQARGRQLIEAMQDRDTALKKVEATIAELEDMKDTNAASASVIAKLRAQVRDFESAASTTDLSRWQAGAYARSLADALNSDAVTRLQKQIEAMRDPGGISKFQKQIEALRDPGGLGKLQKQIEALKNPGLLGIDLTTIQPSSKIVETAQRLAKATKPKKD